MGTRGFMGLVIDGQQKIGYVHWDSYPDGLGKDVLEVLRAMLLADTGEQITTLAKRLKVVSPKSTPTADEQARLARYADQNVSTKSLDEWYVLLRRTHGDMLATLEAGYIEDASEFPYDSLYAEWGYLVDFDTKTFEAYEGFQKKPHQLGRFASGSEHEVYSGTTYYPCALVGMWSFEALPTTDEFLKALERSDEEDDD